RGPRFRGCAGRRGRRRPGARDPFRGARDVLLGCARRGRGSRGPGPARRRAARLEGLCRAAARGTASPRLSGDRQGRMTRRGLAGPAAVLLVHAYTMYVYFYLFTRAGLARLDAALLEAAEGLGAGPRTVLTRVTLPLLSPALTGAALLTFMTSLASFSAPYVFG